MIMKRQKVGTEGGKEGQVRNKAKKKKREGRGDTDPEEGGL